MRTVTRIIYIPFVTLLNRVVGLKQRIRWGEFLCVNDLAITNASSLVFVQYFMIGVSNLHTRGIQRIAAISQPVFLLVYDMKI